MNDPAEPQTRATANSVGATANSVGATANSVGATANSVGATAESTPMKRDGAAQGKSVLLVVALLLAGVGLTATKLVSSGAADAASESPAAESPPLPVETIRVGTLVGPTMSQRYAGLLIARRQSELSFERAGRVTRIHVWEGSIVRKGDLLAETDQEDLDASAARAESELEAAKAVLAELTAGPREQSIRAAAARVEELQARVELAKIDADRQKQLAPKGATSRSELDSAIFGLQASKNSLSAAKALLDELNAGTREEQIAAQQAKCAAIQASLREIEAQRNDSKIVAPFDGTISARELDEGVVVSPGTTVLKLVGDVVEAQIGLPPTVAGAIRLDEKVSIRLHDSERDAWVDRTEPVVRRDTRTRVVYLRLHPERSSVPQGFFDSIARAGWVVGEVVEMRAQKMSSATPDGQYWLPRSALVRGTRGLWSVLVLPGDDGSGVCERRTLEILKTDGKFALVQGMISPGERVISDGLHRITAGMRVASASGRSVRKDGEGLTRAEETDR